MDGRSDGQTPNRVEPTILANLIQPNRPFLSNSMRFIIGGACLMSGHSEQR